MSGIVRIFKKALRGPVSFADQLKRYLYFYSLFGMSRLLFAQTNGRLLMYPDDATRPYALWKVCKILGVRRTHDLGHPHARLAIFWKDATYRVLPPELAHLSIPVLNAKCTDISKKRVAVEFARTFGYPMAVDPTTYQGRCVSKSTLNATHDGQVIQCPIQSPEPDREYHLLINNQVDADMVLDLRTPICGNTIPFVYKKYRPLATRFSNTNSRSELAVTTDVFSPEEIARILSFARAMGIDLAELDILRDRDSGRLFVVDVNTTPAGPPNHLPWPDCRAAMHRLARAFAAEFLGPPNTR
ncbi:MAG: hypothetical protein WCI73_11310 [Phycisphaerae bacterium]